MTDTISVKQLANRAGTDPRTLRRILRSRFPREEKGKAYEWQPDDPQIELIIKAVENHKAQTKVEKYKAEKPVTKAVPKPKATKPKAEKTELPKSSVKPGEIDPTTGGTVIDLKPKNPKPIHKTLAQLEAEGVKVSETAVVE
jgi:hypothetical protein